MTDHRGPFIDPPRGGLLRRLFSRDQQASPTSQRPGSAPHQHGSHPQPRRAQHSAPMPSFGGGPKEQGAPGSAFPVRGVVVAILAAVGIGSAVISTVVGSVSSVPNIGDIDIDPPEISTTTATIETIDPDPAPDAIPIGDTGADSGSEIAKIERLAGTRVTLTNLQGERMTMVAASPTVRATLRRCSTVKCIVSWTRDDRDRLIINRVTVTPTPRD